MIITSRYFVFTYLGKDPLTLLEAPKNLSTDDLVKYNKFISSVQTIYTSQATNGLIPTFYKTNNLADPNSSLKTLETNKSYYVIMNSNTVYPVNILAVGGLVSSSGSTQCLVPQSPTISFPAPSFNLEGEANHYQYLTIGFGQLSVGTRYKYTISNFQSNWPVKILPKEGVFTPQATSESINAYLMFAPTLIAEDCPDCFTNYNLDPDYREPYGQNNLYSILQVSIVAEPYDVCVPITDTVFIRCKSCLPRRVENYPMVKFADAPKKTLTSDCAYESLPVIVGCSSFDKGKPYKYVFSLDNSTSTITPSSGIIGFGDGVGQIGALLNIQNQSPIIAKVEVTAQDGSNKTTTDFLTVECTDCI